MSLLILFHFCNSGMLHSNGIRASGLVRDDAFRGDEFSNSLQSVLQLTICASRTSPVLITIPPIDNRVPPISAVVINKSADVFVGKRAAKKHMESYRTEQSQWPSQLLWISLTSLSLSARITFIQLCVPSFPNCVFLIGTIVYFITSHFINHHSISLHPLTISLWLGCIVRKTGILLI